MFHISYSLNQYVAIFLGLGPFRMKRSIDFSVSPVRLFKSQSTSWIGHLRWCLSVFLACAEKIWRLCNPMLLRLISKNNLVSLVLVCVSSSCAGLCSR